MMALFRLRQRLALWVCPELLVRPSAPVERTIYAEGRINVESLVRLANLYAGHRGLKLSTVSTYAANDGKFFTSIGKGAGCTLRKAAAIIAWFSDNWPADLEWPRDIPRPPKSKKEAA